MLNKKKQIFFSVLIICLLILLTNFFSDAFNQLEESILSSKYKIRGETRLDSSIILLYLDNDDIKSLGGWPARRDYYALLINVLTELNAKVIGFDIALTENNAERPQYDTLLANVVKKNGKVVFTSYFRSLTEDEPSLKSRLPEGIGYNLDEGFNFFQGEDLNLPFDLLLENAAGIGHENLTENSKIPLFINSGKKVLPTFSFEVLRVYFEAAKTDIEIEESYTEIFTPDKIINIPFSNKGIININYTGGINSLNAIPIVEFLQAYHLNRRGGFAEIDINIVKDKIILIGVIAEGRSYFLPTPFSNQFPALGVHASIINNALKSNFLKTAPPYFEYFVILIIGIFFSLVIFNRKEIESLFIISGIIFLFILISFLIFAFMEYNIPILKFIFVQLTLSIGFIFYKHQIIKKKVHALESEREIITKKLRDREDKLTKLEAELKEAQIKETTDRAAFLTEEINKYKNELLLLSSEASDLNIFDWQSSRNLKILNFENIIYTSQSPMNKIIEFVKKITENDSPVLILGESGTGKELVARALHNTSKRKSKTFIAVNCGALSETLLESELFGHEKGAFTGAIKEKPGRFELANGGTIFLDEIAETSEAFQVKLLRIIQEGEFERVGGTETKKVNLRVVAATNRDLVTDLEDKKFRQDLYYRLSVFVINLPPLRERKIDLPILADHYLNLEQKGMSISANVMEIFSKYNWPGNIRELRSAITRSVTLAQSEGRDMIRTKDLPDELKSISNSTSDIEEQIILSIRDKQFSYNSISETAKELGGLNRGTVAEYLRGFCFKIFIEQNCEFDLAVIKITESQNSDIIKKARKKLIEYINNAVENIDPKLTSEENILQSKSKFKNLPQKYHPFLESLIKEYQKGTFKIKND